MNPLCVIAPAFCSNGQASSAFGWISDFLSLFSGNAAADTMHSSLQSVEATPQVDLGIAGFVTEFRQLFGLALAFSILMWGVTLLRLVRAQNNGYEYVPGLIGPIKVYAVGIGLLPAGIGIQWATQWLTYGINRWLGNDWESSISHGFNGFGWAVRLLGKFDTACLKIEVIALGMFVPLLIIMGLITYSLTRFKVGYTMGKPSRIMWSLLATAFLLQPVLVFYLGVGGKLILAGSDSEPHRQVATLVLLGVAPWLWLVAFLVVGHKIKTHVENQIKIRDAVRTRQENVTENNMVQQSYNVRMQNINNVYGSEEPHRKEGLRAARHAAVDLALPLAAAKLAAAGTGVGTAAAVGVHLTHSFFRGRRRPLAHPPTDPPF